MTAQITDFRSTAITNPHMLPKVRSDLIMASASGEHCCLRIASFIPGLTCSGRATTVGAHLPVFGKGVNTKVTDMAVCFACATCHDILDCLSSDGRRRNDYLAQHYPTAIMERLLFGLVETHARLIMGGVIVIPDAEFI